MVAISDVFAKRVDGNGSFKSVGNSWSSIFTPLKASNPERPGLT